MRVWTSYDSPRSSGRRRSEARKLIPPAAVLLAGLCLLGAMLGKRSARLDMMSGTLLAIPASGHLAVYDVPDSAGRYHAVRADLNVDGIAEYLVRGLCGTGGCEFVILDGRTTLVMGTVFGDPVCLSWPEDSTFAYIESFSHQSAGTGLYRRYVYDGDKYLLVKSTEMADSAAVDLLARFSRHPRIP